MDLYLDNDIKIAGNKPSLDVERNKALAAAEAGLSAKEINSAKAWGRDVALKFIEDAADMAAMNEDKDFDLIMQRRMLLSFTATVGFESLPSSDSLSGIAQKSFLDTLKKENEEIYLSSADTGAFSFYYLAFRRGSEIDRRMGQTFAMLCSHDGDPIFQELGEALYCWFFSFVEESAKLNGII